MIVSLADHGNRVERVFLLQANIMERVERLKTNQDQIISVAIPGI